MLSLVSIPDLTIAQLFLISHFIANKLLLLLIQLIPSVTFIARLTPDYHPAFMRGPWFLRAQQDTAVDIAM